MEKQPKKRKAATVREAAKEEERQPWLEKQPKRRKASLGECVSNLVPGLPWGGVTRLVYFIHAIITLCVHMV